MSPTLAVVSDTENGNGHGGDLEAELLRLLSQAALARSNEDAQRYAGIAAFLAGLGRKADASIKDLRDIRAALSTIATEQARQGALLQSLERDAESDDERHGQVIAALARIEARESQHRAKLDSVTEEVTSATKAVTEVKKAHSGWLAVGSFMDRHKKVAQAVAVLVLFAMQLFQMLKK